MRPLLVFAVAMAGCYDVDSLLRLHHDGDSAGAPDLGGIDLAGADLASGDLVGADLAVIPVADAGGGGDLATLTCPSGFKPDGGACVARQFVVQASHADWAPFCVRGSAPNDIYVTGWQSPTRSSPTNPIVVHSTGNGVWTPQTVPAGPTSVRAVAIRAPDDLYASTNGGILHSTGDGNWTLHKSGGSYRPIAGGPSGVYVGEYVTAGKVWALSGTGWVDQTPAVAGLTCATWEEVTVLAGGVFLTGNYREGGCGGNYRYATVFSTGNGQWTEVGSGGGSVVWAFSATDVYYGNDNQVFHLESSGWVLHSASAPALTTDVWANAPDDVWLVGDIDAAHFDGSTWTRFALPGAQQPESIWSAGGSDVYVVDAGKGFIYHLE